MNRSQPNAKRLLAFIHIEKTAGETMKWILRSSFGLSHCDISPSLVFRPLLANQLAQIGKIYPTLCSIAGHPVTPYTGLDALCPIQYFTFLREPTRQCASYFQYLSLSLKRMSSDSFNEWICTEWPRNMQTKRLCGEPDAHKAITMVERKNIFIGLTECFDESIFLLQQLVRADLYLGYEARNKASDNTLSKQLLADPATRASIIDAVGEDSKLYEWATKEWVPRYRQQYTQQFGQVVPQSFPFRHGHYRRFATLTNRIYRNLAYRPIEKLIRK